MQPTIQCPFAVDIADLSKIYQRRKQEPVRAVAGVTLKIAGGQVFGFLGPNGAGKTTTIKIACGLIKPTAGSICVNSYDVNKERSAAMRQIGAVLEGARNVYWRLSAWDNLIYFGQLKGVRGKVLRERAEMLLRELELWDRRKDKVRVFSRGMIQKVAIACALIADPPIVLLDEPTLGLDVQAARTVKQWIAKLARERGKTIVLTTHQLDMAQALCDRVAIINKGQIIADKPVRELLDIFRQEYYQIKVRGHWDGQTTALPSALKITEENGNTLFSGPILTQADLYQHLQALREVGLSLVSVNQVEPDLEEIFIRYIDQTVETPGSASANENGKGALS